MERTLRLFIFCIFRCSLVSTIRTTTPSHMEDTTYSRTVEKINPLFASLVGSPFDKEDMDDVAGRFDLIGLLLCSRDYKLKLINKNTI